MSLIGISLHSAIERGPYCACITLFCYSEAAGIHAMRIVECDNGIKRRVSTTASHNTPVDCWCCSQPSWFRKCVERSLETRCRSIACWTYMTRGSYWLTPRGSSYSSFIELKGRKWSAAPVVYVMLEQTNTANNACELSCELLLQSYALVC